MRVMETTQCCQRFGVLLMVWISFIGTINGLDEYDSCGKREARHFQLVKEIPCDMHKEWWCNSPGSAYPLDTMQRFVYENQGLMKRMYGDQRQVNIIKSALENEMSNTVPSDGYTPPPDPTKRGRAWNGKAKKSHGYKPYRDSRNYYSKVKSQPKLRAVKISPDQERPNQPMNDKRTKLRFKTTATHSSLSSSTTSDLYPNTTATLPLTQTPEDAETPSSYTSYENSSNPSLESTEPLSDSTQGKTTNLSETDSYTTTLNTYETEGFPPLDEYEWSESVDSDGQSYAYVTSDLTSSVPPGRENNRVLTHESLSTDSMFPTDTTIEEPLSPFEQDENEGPSLSTHLFPNEFFSSTPGTKPASMKLDAKIEPIFPEELLKTDIPTEELKQKITEALHHQVKIQVSTGSQRTVLPAEELEGKEGELDNLDTVKEPVINRPTAERKNATVPQNISARRPVNKNGNGNMDLKQKSDNPPMAAPHPLPKPSKIIAADPTKTQIYTNELPKKEVPGYNNNMIPMEDRNEDEYVEEYSNSIPTTTTSPPPPLHIPKGINACAAQSQIIAPYWANNTRGQIRAILNMYPFEQYVHFEKCRHEYRQMNCRRGCRCEQQYTHHHLLTVDPHNECRGIFSDWFKFPSCCVCKCYDFSDEVYRRSRYYESDLDDEYPDYFDEDDFEDTEDEGDVDGWGASHYIPRTPKANVRPQMSPRRYPRPNSHVAPPSSEILPPPPLTASNSKSSYSSIDENPDRVEPPLRSLDSFDNVNVYARPVHGSRMLSQGLERVPRSADKNGEGFIRE